MSKNRKHQYDPLPLAELGEIGRMDPLEPEYLPPQSQTASWESKQNISGATRDPGHETQIRDCPGADVSDVGHPTPLTARHRRPLVRQGSTFTAGSESSLHERGPRGKEQRKQESLNSSLLNAILGSGNTECVVQLLNDGAKPSAVCTPTRTSALQLCALRAAREPSAENEAVEIAKILLDKGADLYHLDNCDCTALHLTAWVGATKLLKLLLERYQEQEKRPDRDFKEPKLLDVKSRLPREQSERAQLHASLKDSWNHSHRKVEEKLPVLENGSTALHVACQRVHVHCIQLLIDAGADPTIQDERGFTPIEVLHEDPGSGENAEQDSQEGSESQEPQDDVREEEGWVDVQMLEDAPSRSRSRPRQQPPPGQSFSSMRTVIYQQPSVLSDFSEEPIASSTPPPTPGHRLQGRRTAGNSMGMRLVTAIDYLRTLGGGQFKPKAALHTMVSQGCLEAMEMILSLDQDAVYHLNSSGDTPMHTAIQVRNMEAMKLMMRHNENAVNVKNGIGFTPLMSAVHNQWIEGINELLLANADVSLRDDEGSTVLHLAAEGAELDLLDELLSMPEALQVLEVARDDGKTALFVAVESSSRDRVQLFLRAGAKITHRLVNEMNVLHVAVNREDEDMVELLVDRLRMSDLAEERELLNSLGYCVSAQGYEAPLHIAATNGNLTIVRMLVTAGCNSRVCTSRDPPLNGCTALHLAAQHGHCDVVTTLLDVDSSLMRATDCNDWQPVHMAAHFAQREVLKILIQRGADLATGVRDEQNRMCTALSLLVHSIAKPVDFLEELLNSSITLNEFPVSDQRAIITVNYSILVPGLEGDSGRGNRQMRVINAILETGNYFGQQHLLQHPLVESFMTLKWKKMSLFFYIILAIHVLFVASLTSLVAQIYWWAGDQGAGVQIARVAVFVTSFLIAAQEVLHTIQLGRSYIQDVESWLKWIATSLSFVVALVVFEGVEQQVPPTLSPGEIDSVPLEGALRTGRLGGRWERHVTTLAVLLAYTELLLLLCRFPRWGLRVLMFYKVAINVIKMLLTFSFLIVGFALSFFVQFRGEEPFPTLIQSLGKTIVMGTSEFDYGDIFTGANDTAVGRILFFLFVLLVPVVLMNLLVGLAVSDIATLETKGRKRGLVKQAEFLSTLERLVYSQSVRGCIPIKFQARLPFYLPVDRKMEIFPGKSLRIIFEPFPDNIRNEIVSVAIRNAASNVTTDGVEIYGDVHSRCRHVEDGKILEEIVAIRRQMVTRLDLHDAHERQERHFRSVHRELQDIKARLEHALNSISDTKQ